MEKTVNTAWYAKKCALGTLVCCGTELVLLMLASALILRGAISEEMANGAVLVCAAVAVFSATADATMPRGVITADDFAEMSLIDEEISGIAALVIQEEFIDLAR